MEYSLKLLFLFKSLDKVNKIITTLEDFDVKFEYKLVSEEGNFFNLLSSDKFDLAIVEEQFLFDDEGNFTFSSSSGFPSVDIIMHSLFFDDYIFTNAFINGVKNIILENKEPLFIPYLKALVEKKEIEAKTIELNKKLIKHDKAIQLDNSVYKYLINNIAEPLSIIQNGILVFYNEYFSKLLEYDFDELMGKNYKELFSIKGLEILKERTAKLQMGEYVDNKYITYLKSKSENEIPVEATIHIINFAGEKATFAILRDIREELNARISLNKKIKSEQIIRKTTNKFVDLSYENFNKDLKWFLSQIGTFLKADNCELFELSNSEYIFERAYSWKSPRNPHIGKIDIRDFEIDMHQMFDFHKPFLINDIEDLVNEKNLYKFLKSVGVKSLYMHPIYSNKKNMGVIAISYVRKVEWTEEEFDFLRIISETLSTIISRKESYFEILKLSRVVEQSPTAVLITDKDGKIEYVNKQFKLITGYSRADSLGQNPRILKSEDTPKETHKEMWDAILKGYEWFGEIINKRKDGRKYWAAMHISPIINDNGEITHFVGIQEDITAKKSFEMELKRHRIAMESSTDGIAILDENANYVYVNQAHAEIYGYNNPNDFYGKSWEMLYEEEQIKIFNEEYFPQLNKNGYWKGESIGKRKDGSKFYQEISLNKIEIGGYVCIVRDISYRKKIEIELQQSEERFRGLYENATIGIYRTSIDGEIIMANPAMVKMLGFKSFEELKKIKISDLYADKEYRQKIIDDINKTKNKKIRADIELIKPNKEHIFVTINSRIVYSETEGTFFEGTIEDITYRKEIENELRVAKEKAEESDKLKSEFLAQMSHEIRTPINSILNFSSLIKDELQGTDNEIIQMSFESIDNAGKRIIRTIDSILNMSELQTGSFDFNPQEIVIDKIIEPLANEYSYRAKSKGLEFEFIDNAKVKKVFVDEYSTTKIFDNLIDNAIKYTEKGKVVIETANPYKNILEIKIKDTGIGIKKDYLPRLFEPFTQQEQGYTRKYEGNGLGMALVKRYCDYNEAQITVDSVENQGSEFKVSFKTIIM